MSFIKRLILKAQWADIDNDKKMRRLKKVTRHLSFLKEFFCVKMQVFSLLSSFKFQINFQLFNRCADYRSTYWCIFICILLTFCAEKRWVTKLKFSRISTFDFRSLNMRCIAYWFRKNFLNYWNLTIDDLSKSWFQKIS